MFVQIMEGRVGDREGVRTAADRWSSELRPGAVGFLRSVVGTSEDGRFVVVACFDSAESARANSERPEQGEWFAELERSLDGDVTFAESPEVTELLAGLTDQAGFVQVMKVIGAERALVDRLDELFSSFSDHRPDLLGVLRVWTSATDYVEVACFTSEEEARRGEAGELPDELQAAMGGFEDLLARTEFIDVTDVWHH